MSVKYVVDSSAWVEYLLGTNKGLKIKQIIEQEEILTSVLAIAELADKFTRDKEDFTKNLAFIEKISSILPLTVEIALNAASLKNRFRQNSPKISLADCIHLSTAQLQKITLVTSDYDFSGADNVMLIS